MRQWKKYFAGEFSLKAGEEESVERYETVKHFSIYYEMQTLVSVGVILICAASGILLYKNIDTLGHLILVVACGLISVLCFAFCIWKKQNQLNYTYYDNILYLGNVMLVTCVGYWQYQYAVFGTHDQLAALVPAVLVSIAAYFFYDRAVLSLAITLWAAYLGLTISLPALIMGRNFQSLYLIVVSLFFALALAVVAAVHYRTRYKNLFGFVLGAFSFHIFCWALLSGMVTQEFAILWLVTLIIVSFGGVLFSLVENSYVTYVTAVLYAYAGISYIIIHSLYTYHIAESQYFLLIYFIATSIMLIKYLRQARHKLFMMA